MTETDESREKLASTRCIFCRSTENLTAEHVFPAFMGGKLVVKELTQDAVCVERFK